MMLGNNREDQFLILCVRLEFQWIKAEKHEIVLLCYKFLIGLILKLQLGLSLAIFLALASNTRAIMLLFAAVKLGYRLGSW